MASTKRRAWWIFETGGLSCRGRSTLGSRWRAHCTETATHMALQRLITSCMRAAAAHMNAWNQERYLALFVSDDYRALPFRCTVKPGRFNFFMYIFFLYTYHVFWQVAGLTEVATPGNATPAFQT